jgi:hypothetical protein
MTLPADVLVVDGNGNTLFTAEMPHIYLDTFEAGEVHVSDTGNLIVTILLVEEDA